MAVKIGTLLIEAKVLTLDQLEEGLQAQVMFGGRIGTNLIELGFITEEFLAQFLAKQLHIPFCQTEQLKNISEDIINMVPRELIAKHRVIPVRKTKTEIWLAMVDPSSLEALDEVAFATDHKIFPMVAPEVQVVDAMERYYHIPKEQRYVQLSQNAENGGMSLTHSTREFLDESGSPITKPKSYPPVGAAMALQFPDSDDKPQRKKKSASKAERSTVLDSKKDDPLFPLQDIVEVLIDAHNKEDIFKAIQSPFIEFFKRYALFINKKDIMVGHDAFGVDFSREKIEKVAVPLEVPSIFRDAARAKAPIFGPLPNGHNNQRIATLLNTKPEDGPCLLCPIPLIEKVGVMIYADRCQDVEGVKQRLDKFRALMNKAGLAFQVLVLKQKIIT